MDFDSIIPTPPQGFMLDDTPKPPPGFNMDVPEPPSGFKLDGVSGQETQQPDLARDIEPLPEADVTSFGPRAAGALVGGAATFAASGMAGYAKLLTSGPEEAVKTIEEIQGFFPKHLLPEKHEMEAFEKTPPMWLLGKIHEYKERIGDKTMEVTGSPSAGALAATMFEAAVFLGLPWLMKGVNAAIKTKRANSLFFLEKDARVKKALADYEASKKGMPLIEPDKTPARSEIPGKPETELHPADVPIRTDIEPKVLRPDQEALLKGRTMTKEPFAEPSPLLKPDETPVKSARVPTVEERLGKRPVYEGKSDPVRVIPEKPKPKAKESAKVVGEIKPQEPQQKQTSSQAGKTFTYDIEDTILSIEEGMFSEPRMTQAVGIESAIADIEGILWDYEQTNPSAGELKAAKELVNTAKKVVKRKLGIGVVEKPAPKAKSKAVVKAKEPAPKAKPKEPVAPEGEKWGAFTLGESEGKWAYRTGDMQIGRSYDTREQAIAGKKVATIPPSKRPEAQSKKVIPARDTELTTVDEISERMKSIDSQVEKLERVQNPKDFDAHHQKIVKLHNRKDALNARKWKLSKAETKPTPAEVLGKSEIAQRAKEQYKGWKGKSDVKTAQGKLDKASIAVTKSEKVVDKLDLIPTSKKTDINLRRMEVERIAKKKHDKAIDAQEKARRDLRKAKLAEEEAKLPDYEEPKPVKPKVKVETKGKKKEVKVDIPKAEADALSPKEQKAYLMAEIDTAIEHQAQELVKGEGITHEGAMMILNAKKGEGFRKPLGKEYTFKVPGDGEFKIWGENLVEFKKRAKSIFPASLKSGKFKPSTAGQVQYGTEIKKYHKLIGKKLKDLKPSDLFDIFREAETKFVKREGMDVRYIQDSSHFTNWLLNEKVSNPVKKKILELHEIKKPLKKGTTLSMLGTQGVYEGVAKEVPKLHDLGKKTVQAVQDFGSVEPRFIRHNAPETGFHAKNYFSKWAAWEERTLDKISEVAEVANYDKSATGLDAVLAIGSEKALKAAPEGVKAVGKEVLGFTENIKKEYAKRGVKLDFKGRIISEIKELIKNAEDAEIPELEKALKTAEDMQFLHIPTAMWMESKIGSPTGGKVLKLLATQKRKSLNIKTLIDKGLIDPKDVNVFDIMASYGRRAGRDFALLDLKDAAKKEGLFTKEQTLKNIVKIPGYESPIFADGHMHPILADYIRGELLGKGLNLGKIGKVFSLAKLSAFINPAILPFYDTMQHSMIALTNKWSRKAPKSNIPGYHLAKGAKQFIERSPEYYEALDNGLASKPHNNPFGTYKNLAEWAKKSKQEKAFSVLNNIFDKKVVLNIYRASFETAWQLDQMIRMGSFDLLRKKGFSVREAAQMAAKAHSDYASVPASTRRMLNIPFFTPTFKLTMGKFYGTMMKDAAKYGKNLGGVLGKVDPKTKVFAGALAGTVMANLAYDQLMTQGFKMKRDEFGRRYTKDVETEQGTKELTITMSSPINMWQKYVFRAIASRSPEVAKPWVRFFEQNKWEIQPIFRVAYEIGTNNNGKGDKIYSEFDTPPVATIKSLRYATKSIVRLFGLVDRDPSDKEGIETFKKEYGKLTEILLRPITFMYMRSPETKRIGYKIKAVQNRFNKQLRRGQIKPQHIEEYQRQLERLLNQVK